MEVIVVQYGLQCRAVLLTFAIPFSPNWGQTPRNNLVGNCTPIIPIFLM